MSTGLLPAGLADFARAARAAGRPLCLVRVRSVRGSAPRATDAALLVDAGGAAGTIGGGHLEFEAIRVARALLARGAGPGDDVDVRRFALGPSLGQCCGGNVELGFSIVGDVEAALPLLAALEPHPHRVWLYGAGHVARALVHVLLPLPFAVRWLDTRDDVFPGDLPGQVEPVCIDDPAFEAAHASDGVFHLIMTHSHALDFDIAHAVLARGNAAYCGLIGSDTKRITFQRRLRARGMDEARIARMACPIGAPHVHGKLPGVIAVAVAAQLLEMTASPTPVSRRKPQLASSLNDRCSS